MRDLKRYAIALVILPALLLLATPAPAFGSGAFGYAGFGYVGPGPGLEMIPYFFSLLAWAGTALVATLAWPIASLVRRHRPGVVGANAVASPAGHADGRAP